MCGIVGKINRDRQQPVDANLIGRMLEKMAHRGPDGEGKYIHGPVGLGHRRLSIIDLSNCGAQPMCNEDGTVWIVFNGEIYNYLELRERLAKRGHTFRSLTDTEVIIHLYEEDGTDCLRHLRGMFAFAIWDTSYQRLFLARDRVGIKPLYYCQTADAFWFASEIKSILADPAVPHEVYTPAIRQFLSFYYPPGEDTLSRPVKKLMPGHYLTVENGKVRIVQYWDLRFTKDRWATSFEEAVEELRDLLESTVTDHMISRRPGRCSAQRGNGFVRHVELRGPRHSKENQDFHGRVSEAARWWTRGRTLVWRRSSLAVNTMTLALPPQDFWKFLPTYVWHMEEPVCEPPAVALYYISKLASQHVKVVLSGEGGDEAFAGYPNYPNMLASERVNAALGALTRPVGTFGAIAGRLLGDGRVQRYGAALGRPFANHYFSRTSGPTFYFNREAKNLFTPDFLENTSLVDCSAFVARLAENVRAESLLNQMLYVDTKTWLPGDLLLKADKMTMANSLELRVPLLDHQVLEFAASLPSEYKVRKWQTKRVLKAALAKVLPSEILTRRKVGFPVPYASWLREGLSGPVRDILLSDRAQSRGYFQKGAIERLLQRNAVDGKSMKEVFSLLTLELWHTAFMDAQKTPGNNFLGVQQKS